MPNATKKFREHYKEYYEDKPVIKIIDHVSLFGFFISIVGIFSLLFGIADDIKIIICIGALALTAICLVALNFGISFRAWMIQEHLNKTVKEIGEDKNKLKHSIYELERNLRNTKKTIERISFANESVSSMAHDFTHELRDALLCFCEDKECEINPDGELNSFISVAVEQIKSIYETITGDRSSVCIKTYRKSDDDDYGTVTTFLRDKNSRTSRSNIDSTCPEYSIKDSEAFFRIVSKDFRDRYFVSDNLEDTKYYSIYPKWREIYNATLVVPIRRRLKNEEGQLTLEFDTFGFLCVDNMKGTFDNVPSIQLLSALADTLYCLFFLHKCFIDKGEFHEKNDRSCNI